MSSGIYETWAEKYYEVGLVCVPITRGFKAPQYKGWTKAFSYRVPSPEEMESWVSRCGGDGIGLACGKSSGVIAVDFDFEGDFSERLEAMVIASLPVSPVVKKGRKGWTRFYKWTEAIENTQIDRGSVRFIDILSTGKQTVLPPTIHPDTNEPYVWLSGETLLDIDIDELPSISRRDIHDLRQIADLSFRELSEFNSDDKSRHDKVFGFIIKTAEYATDMDDLVRKTMRFDRAVNGRDVKGAYFEDPKYKMGNPPQAACRAFCERVCDWKRRKAMASGVEWDIGIPTAYWGEEGKRSSKYSDFVSFLEFNYEGIRFDKITQTAYYWLRGRKTWEPIENMVRAIESRAMEVGIAPTHVARHLDRYIGTLPERLIIDIGRWDGKDHIGSMCAHLGVTNIKLEYVAELFKEWMASVFRRLESPENQNHFLVIKGGQGMGKDTFINHMCKGFGNYFGELTFDRNKKETAQVMSGLLVGVVPEFDDTHKTSISELKSLITQRGEVIRTPYARKAKHVPFYTSFISSVNFDHIFRDSSGNRRFMLFEISEIDWGFKSVDSMAVLGQAFRLYQDGYRASSEARRAMDEYIAGETPESMDDMFVDEVRDYLLDRERMITGVIDRKIRWSEISDDVMKLARNYKFGVRRTQSILKKAGFTQRDTASSYYKVPENC